jgi:hypothetical protein
MSALRRLCSIFHINYKIVKYCVLTLFQTFVWSKVKKTKGYNFIIWVKIKFYPQIKQVFNFFFSFSTAGSDEWWIHCHRPVLCFSCVMFKLDWIQHMFLYHIYPGCITYVLSKIISQKQNDIFVVQFWCSNII